LASQAQNIFIKIAPFHL